MAFEQTSRLPFLDRFSVQVSMQILPSGSEYEAYLSADMGKMHHFHIGLKPHDVAELNSELQQTIEQIANSFEAGALPSDALTTLVEKGSFAFKRIFPDISLRKFLTNMLKRGSTVHIPAEDFFIPWELLYDGDVDDTVNIYRFWGMRTIVSRAIIQYGGSDNLVSPSPIIETSRPHVGLIAYKGLEQVSRKEIPALQKLHREKQIQLSFLRPMKAEQREKGLAGFGRFLRKNVQIVHLACHAFEQNPLSRSYLLVSDDFSISLQDFFVREFEITHNPFVILNACLTGTISPLHTSSWAAEFWKRGARGVLATEFHVPDWFAAAFTEELYKHLLAGKPIGQALVAIRQGFWEKQRNPLGLAYALYSSPSIRIVNPN